MPLETYFSALILATALVALVLLFLLARRLHSGQAPENAAPQNLTARLKRTLVYVLRLVGFTVLVLLLLGGGVLVYVDYHSMLDELAPAPSQVELPPDLPFQVQEVSFSGGDDLQMAGWYVPPATDNGATIILLHGYGGNRTNMTWHADVLVRAGYGILMYDERASGESQGSRRSYGWEDAADAGGALDYLNRRTGGGQARVAIAGCSMGGQIALQAAARYPQIAAVWADGPATIRGRDVSIHNWQTLVGFASGQVLDLMYVWVAGIEAPSAMIDLIGTIEPRPVTLVAGGKPKPLFGPETWRIETFARYAGNHTNLWVIPEATHCDGPARRPQEYAERMQGFFDSTFDISR